MTDGKSGRFNCKTESSTQLELTADDAWMETYLSLLQIAEAHL